MFTGNIRAYPITNRDTPVTILLKIVPSVSLRSPRLSRQGFYIRLYSDWQACKVSYLRGNRCHRHSFPAFPPCTPCVFVITPLRDSHAITVIACRGFSCPVLTDYNPFIFFKYDISCISPVCVPACCLPMYPPFSHGSTGTG